MIPLKSIAIVTPTYAPDYAVCVDLHRSMLKFTDNSVVHYLIAPPADVELFKSLRGPRIWSDESGRVSYGRWTHEHDGKHHPPHADDKCEEEQTPVMARITVVTPFLRSQDACAISTTVTSNRHS
jgi:hypothetical protein